MSAPSPMVSVALCTHNGAGYIRQQLASILAQTRSVDEIVVGDDDSTDGTLEFIRRAALESSIEFLVLASSPRLGVTANFDRTIAACRGDLIALSDQDDVWVPTRIEEQVRAFRELPAAALIFTDATLIDDVGRPLGRTMFESLRFSPHERSAIRGGDAFPALLRRNVATGATMMLRRELALASSPFPTEWVHDEWLAVMAAATGIIDFSDQPLISYRQHGANQIGAANPGFAHRLSRLIERRGDRNRALAAKFAALRARLDAAGSCTPREYRAAAAEKSEFESRRASMSSSRLRRGPEVLWEAARGDYSRYSSQGMLDVIRDLLQPA